MLGIYAYFDKKDNSVAYVGKDSYIDKSRRDKSHHSLSHYNKQPFNRVLQSNPNRYIYQVLVWDVKDQDTLNALEIQYITQLKPKFNFTDGGDGSLGYKHSKETKRKMVKNHYDCSGENNPMYGKKGKDNPMYGKNHSEETKLKISNANKGKIFTREHKRRLSDAKAKYSLWNVREVHFVKSKMYRDNRKPNPCKCFGLRYDGYTVPCGGFMDFVTVELIHTLIKDDVVVGL